MIELKGPPISKPPSALHGSNPAVTYVYFMDQPVLTPTGLSALKFNAPGPTVGNIQLSLVMHSIGRRIDEAMPNQSIFTRYQSTHPASPMPGATHMVFVRPVKVLGSGNTFAEAEVEVRVVVAATKTTVWSGEMKMAPGAEFTAKAAAEIMRVVRELGIAP